MSRLLKLLAVAAFSISSIAGLAQMVHDGPPPPRMSPLPFSEDAANMTRCNLLNHHRLELNKCCNYPHISLHRILVDSCLDECVASKDACCPIGCLWRITKIVYDERTVNLNGFKKTLKNSVYFDHTWEDIIERTVDTCAKEVPDEGLDPQCQYPQHLSKLIGCTIKKLFLQCPTMNALPACEVTKQYVVECM